MNYTKEQALKNAEQREQEYIAMLKDLGIKLIVNSQVVVEGLI